MLVCAKDIRKARDQNQSTKISQRLFFAYALLYSARIGEFLGGACQIVRATKTNSVYVHAPLALGTVRISDHFKHGNGFRQVIIAKNHPKDDDLAQILDEMFRRCYTCGNHKPTGTVPTWDQIKERTGAAS